MKHLPISAGLEQYETQAAELFSQWKTGDARATDLLRHRLPRFLDEGIPWLPKKLTDEDIRSAPLDLTDMRQALARHYEFGDWDSLASWVHQVTAPGSMTFRFESAADALVGGDVAELRRLLEETPELVSRRSIRITHFDPPHHGAMLLHYVSCNGVEGYRQKSPKNAVDVARTLLDAGAEVDAAANFYGGECTTLSLLVSSAPPAKAGVQVALTELLLDYGAAVEGRGSGKWVSPLMTALAFGYNGAANALVRRGAKIETLAAAAGLGRVDTMARLFPSTADDRRRALALAAQSGHTEAVRMLLDRGEDPNRFNPEGVHAHSTPLHQAAFAGHADVVRLLVGRGARLDIADKIWKSTPLGWAEYAGRDEIAAYLRAAGRNA